MATATLDSAGRITIPAEVSAALGLKPGDEVAFVEMPNGNFALLPRNCSVNVLKGLISKPAEPVAIEDLSFR